MKGDNPTKIMSKKTIKAKVGRPSKGGKPVTMRLSAHSISCCAALAAAWDCDQTAAVEQALALCDRLLASGKLPPLA
jgi:hypothetical protein